MTSTAGERIKALEIALTNEMRERDFYLKQSDRTTNPLGKAMFQNIAKDEEEHYQRIIALHAMLKEKGKWPDSLPLVVKGINVKAILLKMLNEVKSLPLADDDDIKAISIAIDFEKKGVAFYENLKNSVEEQQEKAFYSTLSALEREHLLSLQDSYEFFRDPEGWYRTKEKHHLDGA